MGGFAFLAKQRGFDVTGIELSSEQCEIAKEVFGIDLLNINIFNIRDSIGKFDIIHLHHVMEHLTSPSEMFEIISRLLDDNGILLIEVPYQLGKMQDSIKKRKKKNVKFNIDHLYFFSPVTLKKYIHKYGFEVIEFNQSRNRQRKKILSAPKNIFHKIADSFMIPSGSFLEFYCRKI
ncbi:MAG: methyltransferase domain-containing protein [Candidatus Lokiarchaeota archaeon]|nr:methyltransferase domain-containing protein [Candidatus Lokiarchaeota archaeon]